jgi:predicted Zn-dependent protease
MGQQNAIGSRVAAQFAGKFQDANCQLKEGHFLVSSGKTKLSSYANSSDPVIGGRLLREGNEILREAIANKGQDKNPAAYYWLGRITMLLGDVNGADSAFSKAEALAPACKDDIRKYRYGTWAALANAGSQFRQAKQTDSALIMYRAANLILPGGTLTNINMADIFNSANQSDSAIYYFGRAAQTEPTEPSQVKMRDQAGYNYGVLLLNAKRAPEAVAAFHSYLARQPDDLGAKKALAQAFRAAGMPDSAQAIERQIVAGADTGGAGGDDAVSDNDLFELATHQYHDKNYAEAATSYGRLLRRNPNHHDALYAQANSYLALQNGTGLITAAEKLVALDPLGEFNYRLLAQGYKFEKRQDKLAETIIAQFALPVDLQVDSFEPTADDATFSAKAVGREARDANNKLLPVRAVTIAVEFLGKDGAVLATQEASIPALKPGESAPVQVKAKAPGATAWRYHVK